MRFILLIAVLLPSIASAAEWVKLGETPEAQIMLDKKRTENLRGNVTAWLKFNYRKEQPGQTITQGKAFDSSINQYFVDCNTRKFQVLQLFMFHKGERVGAFLQQLNMNALDEAKPGTAATFLLDKVCPANKPVAANKKN